MDNNLLKQLDIVTNKTYNKIIKEDLTPKVMKIYAFISGELGYTKELWYGDTDVYVDLINVGTDKWGRKTEILRIRNVVTCFDRYQIVLRIVDGEVNLCQCVEGGEGVKYEGYNFGDHRDWEQVTFDVLKEHNFKFGYEDNRDEFHVFSPNLVGEGYNDWWEGHYGCGFIQENIRYVIQEVDWTYQQVIKTKCFAVEGK